jgi:hypothetical protein
MVLYTKTRRTRFEQARANRRDHVQPGLLPVCDTALLWRHTFLRSSWRTHGGYQSWCCYLDDLVDNDMRLECIFSDNNM